MNSGLLNEHESFLNVALGAAALAEFIAAFQRAAERSNESATLWHLATVLPLVFQETSRRAIAKRQVRSGLRSILARDPANDMAQNEAIFDLNGRMRAAHTRTMRSLNCSIVFGLIEIREGSITSLSTVPPAVCSGAAGDIVSCAAKLGRWAGDMTAFEYFTVLGVDPKR